jgi:hypothetical protein
VCGVGENLESCMELPTSYEQYNIVELVCNVMTNIEYSTSCTKK